MGVKLSKDLRSQGQKTVEKSLGVHLNYRQNDIKLLDVGVFKNGEFRKIGSLQDSQDSVKSVGALNYQQTTKDFMLVISSEWITEEVRPELHFIGFDNIMIPPDLLPFQPESPTRDNHLKIQPFSTIYVVTKIIKGTRFDMGSPTEQVLHNDPETPKVWGYELRKCKIVKKHADKQTRENNFHQIDAL